jgi:hypothetical protein
MEPLKSIFLIGVFRACSAATGNSTSLQLAHRQWFLLLKVVPALETHGKPSRRVRGSLIRFLDRFLGKANGFRSNFISELGLKGLQVNIPVTFFKCSQWGVLTATSGFLAQDWFLVISPARKGSKSRRPLVSEDSVWPSLSGKREFLTSRWKVASSRGVPMEVASARRPVAAMERGRAMAQAQGRALLRHGWRGTQSVAQSTLAYEEVVVQGSGTGQVKTAMMVHGLMGSGRNWRTVSKRLASAIVDSTPGAPGECRVIARFAVSRLPGSAFAHCCEIIRWL